MVNERIWKIYSSKSKFSIQTVRTPKSETQCLIRVWMLQHMVESVVQGSEEVRTAQQTLKSVSLRLHRVWTKMRWLRMKNGFSCTCPDARHKSTKDSSEGSDTTNSVRMSPMEIRQICRINSLIHHVSRCMLKEISYLYSL
jgi:hypothetical protein